MCAERVGNGDQEFWCRLAAFAYAGYLEEGSGAVFIKELPDEFYCDSDIGQHLLYVPEPLARRAFPPHAATVITEYAPKREAVLLMFDTKVNPICMRLTAHNLGLCPLDAYEKEHGLQVFKPGQLLRVRQSFQDVGSGYYVFLHRQGGWLHVCRASLDATNELCRTGDATKVHLDFEEMFEPVADIVVPANG